MSANGNGKPVPQQKPAGFELTVAAVLESHRYVRGALRCLARARSLYPAAARQDPAGWMVAKGNLDSIECELRRRLAEFGPGEESKVHPYP